MRIYIYIYQGAKMNKVNNKKSYEARLRKTRSMYAWKTCIFSVKLQSRYQDLR